MQDFGIRIDRLPRTLNYVRTLEGYEGDILAEYKAESGGSVYIEKWCDCEGNLNRYLIVRTEQRAIAEYLGKRISMLDLLQKASDLNGFLIDRDPNRTIVNIFSVRLAEIPQYLPSPEAFHDENLQPNWQRSPQNFLIDNDWSVGNISVIERNYLNVYCFTFFTLPNSGREIPLSVRNYTYRGGFPVGRSYERLRQAIPRNENAKSIGVSAASPGVLTIEASSQIASHLISTLQNLPEAKPAYKILHQWSKLDASQAELLPTSAYDDLCNLCELLNVDVTALVGSEQLTQKKIYIAGKLIAAQYRKLLKVAKQDSGVDFLNLQAAAPNLQIEVEEDEIDTNDDETDDSN